MPLKMTLFEFIDSLTTVAALRRVYNNLPSEVCLLPEVTEVPSHEDCQRAKIYTLERMNSLRGII